MPRRALYVLLLAPLWGCGSSALPPGAVPVVQEPPPQLHELNYHVEKDRAQLMVNLDNLLRRHEETGDPHLRRDIEGVIGRYVSHNFGTLLGELRTGSARNKSIAAGAVGFAGRVRMSKPVCEPREAVPMLLAALSEQDPVLLANALLSLWLLAEPTTMVAPILPLASHADPAVRGNAVLALSVIVRPGHGEEAIVALTLAAADQDPVVRVHAAQAIAHLRSPSSTGYLINLLQDPIPLVRARAAIGLAELKDRTALRPLVLALRRETAPVPRDAIVRALREISGESFDADPKKWEEWFAQLPPGPEPVQR